MSRIFDRNEKAPSQERKSMTAVNVAHISAPRWRRKIMLSRMNSINFELYEQLIDVCIIFEDLGCLHNDSLHIRRTLDASVHIAIFKI